MPDWTLLVPMKDLTRAKTRLQPPSGVSRRELALAFARDALRAARQLPALDIVLVTDDTAVAQLLADDADRIIGDAPAGLNAALADAASRCAPGPVAAMTADLPALKPSSLRRTLEQAADTAYAVVPDAAGTGTTLLAASSPALFRPGFGPGSRRAHERDGALVLTAGADLRQDVDTLADLAAAGRLGLGPATSALLDRVSLLEQVSLPEPTCR